MNKVWIVKHITFDSDSFYFEVEVYDSKEKALEGAEEVYEKVLEYWNQYFAKYTNETKKLRHNNNPEEGYYKVYMEGSFSTEGDEIITEEKILY